MDERLNIILSPHFDDAVLSLGGFIAKAPERAVVVTIFAGTPAENLAGRWDRWSGFATAAAAMRARSEENERALAVLGVPPSAILNLGHLDNQYRVRQRSGGMSVADLRLAIGQDICRVVRDHGSRVNLFAPASAWHPDHRIVTDAVLDLWPGGERSEADIFLYQDQPYAYLELRRKSLMPLRLAKFSTLNEKITKRVPKEMERKLIDIEKKYLLKKMDSLKQYESQFRFIKAFLRKMLRDFSYYQARDADLTSCHVEVVYRLATRPILQS